jgi:uncharacterized protein (TIGR01244 family)
MKSVARERVVVASQPSREDLAALRDNGVTDVLNLRTEDEMEKEVSFDEAATAKALGLVYEAVPIGGSTHPYRPEAVEALRQRLAAAKGKVLVHCAVGGRASLVWAAYAVKYLGLSPDEAMRMVAHFDDSGWSSPLEKLTDIPMVLERRAPK